MTWQALSDKVDELDALRLSFNKCIKHDAEYLISKAVKLEQELIEAMPPSKVGDPVDPVKNEKLARIHRTLVGVVSLKEGYLVVKNNAEEVIGNHEKR
jgi:hypothetical protein